MRTQIFTVFAMAFALIALTLSCDKYGDMDDDRLEVEGTLYDVEEIRKLCSSASIAPPVYVERSTGRPQTVEIPFHKGGEFDLCVIVKAVTPKAPASAVVMIDDVPVAYTSDFNANFKSLVRRIANSKIGPGEHTLKVSVAGKPGTALQVLLAAGGRQIKIYDDYDPEDLYVNSQKARLLEEEERPLLFQLSMKRYITPGELYELLKDSGGAEITRVVFKVFNGEHWCSMPRDFGGNEMLLKTKEFLREQYDAGKFAPLCGEDVRTALQFDRDSGHISPAIFEATGTPRGMYEFWEKYPHEIRVIQTIAHDLEKAQRGFWPDQEFLP